MEEADNIHSTSQVIVITKGCTFETFRGEDNL